MSEPYRNLPPKEGDNEVVVVATRGTAVEAEMAREYLRSHGIEAFVQESASFNPIINYAAGGARISVRSVDAALARSLLTRLEKTSDDENESDHDDGEVRCPRCELAYCYHERAFMSSALGASAPLLPVAAFAALLLTPFSPKRWRCHKCLYIWDDPKAGPARMTPLDPDDPRPVFRLRRGRGGTGLFFGLMFMFVFFVALAALRAPKPLLLLPLLSPIVGLAIGRRLTSDVCSAPGCRAELLPDASICPVCRGAIAGTITAANEHYAEAATFRRDLAELKARDSKKAQAKKRTPKKPPKTPAKIQPPS